MNTQAKKTARVAEILEQTLGIPERSNVLPPLDNLMLTLLSQNTNDRNRDIAYQRLRDRLPTWEAVLAAPVAQIADAIRPAGLANQKSQRMQAILRWIQTTYGALNLDCLCDMDAQDAMRTFCQLKGIGVKTMAVVLTFSCGKDVFPVDTHVHRLCKRIGLVPPDTSSAEKTFELMKPLVPAGKAFSLHLNLITHGRTICLARKPACARCPLRDLCDAYQTSSLRP